jgi:hypothetical protein
VAKLSDCLPMPFFILILFIWIESAFSQPQIRFLPPLTFAISNHYLIFDLAITNSGTEPFRFADRRTNASDFKAAGVVRDMFEVSLADTMGHIVRERITDAVFKFKSRDEPTIAPGEMVLAPPGWGGGVFDLVGVSNGLYILVIRLNPEGRRWPGRFFHEEGTFVQLKISGTNVMRWMPPRPQTGPNPEPPAWVLQKLQRYPPKPPPLPELSRSKKPIYPGKVPR